MKSLINKTRRLNISNSIIESSTGFDAVQLKAYNQDPSEFPIMTGRLKAFLLARQLERYKRVQLNFMPISHSNVPTSHDLTSGKDNILFRGWKVLKRRFQRKVI